MEINAELNTLPAEDDPREIQRRDILLKRISEGDPWAPGELQFRRVMSQRGLQYEQIQQSILNAFAI